MKSFKVTLEKITFDVPPSLDITPSNNLVQALGKIVEANYNYAFKKYGNVDKVKDYECVKIARAALELQGLQFIVKFQ